MSTVIKLPGVSDVPPRTPRTMHSRMDTVEITMEAIKHWHRFQYQRPLRVTKRVIAISLEIKEDGVIPGIITVGELDGVIYIVDGQHRLKAFELAGIDHAYADVRFMKFETMEELTEEFNNLQQSISPFKPDDKLRALEASNKALSNLRRAASFVGYDSVKRPGSAIMLSMSMVLRCWAASANDNPSMTSSGKSSFVLGQELTNEDAQRLAIFLNCCMDAWGRDKEYYRLWGNLNLVITMWLWRRTVLGGHSARSVRLKPEIFTNCLMGLSADHQYMLWLVGRNFHERDRSPAYNRIKTVFTKRLLGVLGGKPILPAPNWAAHFNYR